MPASPARILFVHYGDDWIRGSEQCLIDLLAGLDRARFAPIVWCNSAELRHELIGRGEDVRSYGFDLLFNWDNDVTRLGPYLRMVRQAKRLLRDAAIDLVHCNSGAPAQWMIPACRACRVPMLSHLHCSYLRRERYVLGLHQSPFLVGVSAATLKEMLADGFPAERTRVIHNGIDIHRIAAPPRPELRRDLGIAEQAFVVLSVGSLIHRKGHDLLIHALERAQRKRPGTQYVGLVVGDGPERGALEHLARQRAVDIRFLGYRRDVGTIFRSAANVLALASRTEALPLVLLEAAFFGIPAIASDVGGIPEAIVRDETGVLVPPEDPDALATALCRLSHDLGLRDRLGAAAHRRMLEKFTSGTMIGAFEELYSQLLAMDRQTLGWLGRWNSLVPYKRLLRPQQA